MRARRTEAPFCNIASHVAGDLHSHVVSRKNEDIARLEAENAAFRAELNRLHPELDNGDLLVHLAAALRTGEEAATASAPSRPTDTDLSRGKPGSRPPHGVNNPAAAAVRQLVTRVTRALDSFETRQDNDWSQPRIDFDNRPKDRCWTRGCAHYSRWFRDECPGCGKSATKTATNSGNNSELQAEPKTA